MSKKVKVMIATLVAVLLLAAIPAAVALAQNGEDESAPAPQLTVRNPLLDRVAEILGISADNLTAAFEQARQERWEEVGSQASGNWSNGPLGFGQFGERLQEKQQKWNTLRERIQEKARDGSCLSDNGTPGAQNWFRQGADSSSGFAPGVRMGNALRGRHMTAAPRGWNGPIPYQPED